MTRCRRKAKKKGAKDLKGEDEDEKGATYSVP